MHDVMLDLETMGTGPRAAIVAKLRTHPDVERNQAPNDGVTLQPLDPRWISIGATDLQRGFMAVIRGIAQPTTF